MPRSGPFPAPRPAARVLAARGGAIRVHVAREGDRLTGALPLLIERRLGLRGARFPGGDAAALADVLVAP
jgi:CelD/BcsL family acetyltransferase involved in cellulose biosynthesis